ncbi:MAG: PaaI family thioesterase [Acidobacteriota bacterium]
MNEVTMPNSPYDALIGSEWISDDPDDARVRLTMRDDHRQPMGIMHGGVMASLIESICSRTCAKAVLPDNRVSMGQNISVSFLRPISDGTVEVVARAVHRGRMSWVWQAEVRDSGGRVCATAQMTTAVRDAPDGVDLSSLTGS